MLYPMSPKVVELKRRLSTWIHGGPGHTDSPERVDVALDDAVAAVQAEVKALYAELDDYVAAQPTWSPS